MRGVHLRQCPLCRGLNSAKKTSVEPHSGRYRGVSTKGDFTVNVEILCKSDDLEF